MSELLLSSFINFLSSKGLISQAYIVGGAVRDIIAAKPLRDIDVAVIRDAVGLGNEFAALTGSTAVPFDRKSATVRVARGGFFIDISSFKGNAIEDDLRQRDITINAMALPLSLAANGLISAKAKDSIIDPLGGLNDLAAKTVRMVSEENLKSDPVRLLRIYRFAATLGFSVDEATAEAAARLAPLAGSSAPERLAEELRHIFSMPDSADAVRMMRYNRLLENILPETKGQLDISMTRYTAVEIAIAAFMQMS
ncbi:MAG: hypothetical protein LLF86_03380, partial [Nitrospiraceae bacterium]|nr:hypothetical protein [Nitrospiraceae bacterium]